MNTTVLHKLMSQGKKIYIAHTFIACHSVENKQINNAKISISVTAKLKSIVWYLSERFMQGLGYLLKSLWHHSLRSKINYYQYDG